jgi:hypothetical protein
VAVVLAEYIPSDPRREVILSFTMDQNLEITSVGVLEPHVPKTLWEQGCCRRGEPQQGRINREHRKLRFSKWHGHEMCAETVQQTGNFEVVGTTMTKYGA